MSVTGSLADFTLPEVFQFIERGGKTGLLTLHTLPALGVQPRRHHIWVYRGQVVAAAPCLDQQSVVSLIQQNQWVSDRVITKLAQFCPTHKPLGLCLKEQGVLQLKHLQRLFQLQVLGPVCALFQHQKGQFEFDQSAPLATREMTGLMVPASSITLMGLRLLKNWDALVEQLPDPTGGLSSIVSGHPHHRLDPLEWQVWEYTEGTVSLKAIAKQLRLPVETVQQIAFRLISVGLAEAHPLFVPSPNAVELFPAQLIQQAKRQNVSQSFLHTLVGFLRSKVYETG